MQVSYDKKTIKAFCWKIGWYSIFTSSLNNLSWCPRLLYHSYLVHELMEITWKSYLLTVEMKNRDLIRRCKPVICSAVWFNSKYVFPLSSLSVSIIIVLELICNPIRAPPATQTPIPPVQTHTYTRLLNNWKSENEIFGCNHNRLLYENKKTIIGGYLMK